MLRRNCCNNSTNNWNNIMMRRPDAVADIRGSKDYPRIMGTAKFYQTGGGVLVVTEVNGLPQNNEVCKAPVFGYHIHGGQECSGNMEDPFADSMAHYNPQDCEHPYHAGDMPPLFGNNGYAYSVFLTGRFKVCEIIGKTVIIHLHPDDFHTQPSGDSGTKIACGEIRRM